MRHTRSPHPFRRAAALALAVLLALPTVYADAGEEKLQTAVDLVDGLTYRNTITVHNSSRTESYSLELPEESSLFPILLQSSGTIYGSATINKAVSRAQEMGYQVLGAINTDFFSTASGVPLGIVIEDGVYKSSAGTNSAICITDGEVSLCEDLAVSLTLTNGRDGTVTTPKHLNKWRTATGGLYLLNQDFSSVSTRTTTDGWYVRMKLVQPEGEDIPSLTVNSTLELEVTELLQTNEAISIGADEYILTADAADNLTEIYASFQLGDRITLTTQCEGELLSSAQWAGGVGDVMIRDGALTDSSNWTYIKDGRAPRTALGLKEDGTLLLYAVDGRKSGHSLGLGQKDLAEELLKQGCLWAVNLDGGGSTSLSAWLPGQTGPTLQNTPSDGKARPCATFLLLVTEETGDGKPHRLALAEDGLVVLAGTSRTLPGGVLLDNVLNPLEVGEADLRASSSGLGTIKNGVYTAGPQTGTDTLRLSSKTLGVEGTAQVHIVDHLTGLTISREGSAAPLTALGVEPGETVQLTLSGTYWGRTALEDWRAVTWTVEGGIGSVDETGLFTASESGGTSTLTATAGGVSQTIQVGMTNIHRDVPEGHWAFPAVEYCYQNGIVGGISAVEYGRDLPIRRADFMLMLYNAAGRPAPKGDCTFTDVAPTDYYYTALAWAQNAGLASGTGGGAFSPNANITREQAFTILRGAMSALDKDCPDAGLVVLEPFSDKDRIAPYAQRPTATLVAQGLVSGKGTGIDPQGQLTRAEMAVLLRAVLIYTPVQDVPTEDTLPETPAEPEVPIGPEIPTTPETPDDPVDYTLTLDQTQLALAGGESAQLTAALTPENGEAQFTWTSSDPTLLLVSSAGRVTNLNRSGEKGTVTVTVRWNDRVAACAVTCAPAQTVGTVVDAERGLNIRSGPGSEHAVIGGLSNGARVVVLETAEGWHKVLYADRSGQAASGWVSADYMTLSE